MNASIKTRNAIHSPSMERQKRQLGMIGRAFVSAGRAMLTHEVPRDAAGISYFGLAALFPAIIVMISIVDAFLGWMNLHDIVLNRIVDLFPGSHQFIKSNLSQVTKPSPTVVISCAVVVLWSSSWIYTFIESGINRAWDVSHQRTFWESRMRGIALIGLGGFSLLFSAAMTTFFSAARVRTEIHIAQSPRAFYFIDLFWYLIPLSAGFLIAVLVFAFVFKWTPHRKILWEDAFPGALVSTTMYQIASFIFAEIVPFFDYQKIYGKMGAIVALLVWVYTSNLILLFGANFSAQLHWKRMELRVPDAPRMKAQNFRSSASHRS